MARRRIVISEAPERFFQFARRTEESATLFWRVHENVGANPAGA